MNFEPIKNTIGAFLCADPVAFDNLAQISSFLLVGGVTLPNLNTKKV